MKKSRFSDHQILAILKQAESGIPVPALYREHGISGVSFYKWRAKFGGMDASMMSRLKELETENRRLRKMYAEERIKVWRPLRESSKAISPPRDGQGGGESARHQYSFGLQMHERQRAVLPLSANFERLERQDY